MVDSENSLQDLLEESRLLAMSCEYVAALDSIEAILRSHPDNLDALRLKGNVLEQRSLDENDYIDALACYEKILGIDPQNTVGVIDHGDHYKNADAFHQAFKYYAAAMDLLEAGEARIGMESEVRELLDTCADLLRYPSASDRARQLEERCEALLSSVREFFLSIFAHIPRAGPRIPAVRSCAHNLRHTCSRRSVTVPLISWAL